MKERNSIKTVYERDCVCEREIVCEMVKKKSLRESKERLCVRERDLKR